MSTNDDESETNVTPNLTIKHGNKQNLSLLLHLSFILAEEDESNCSREAIDDSSTSRNNNLSLSMNDAFCSTNKLDYTPSVGDVEEGNIIAFSPMVVDANTDNCITVHKQRLSILISKNVLCYE